MNEKIKKEIRIDLLMIAITVIVFFILTNFVFKISNVKGHSMEDSLHENDRCLSFYYDLNNIQRFDIVVFNVSSEKELVKRVIGLPNEEIEYKDNKLYVNGIYIEEEFLDNDAITSDFKVILKDNEYYCLGDNRTNSNDSRFYGPINKDSIVSSHIFRFYPFNRIGFMK